MSILGLNGDAIIVDTPPEICPRCQKKNFYKQHDFRRSIGVGIVAVASLISFVLMGMGFNWLTFMSPMVVALLFDRLFSVKRPFAVLCYECALVFRGLKWEQIENIEDFDLEHFDRIHYPKRTGEAPSD